MLRSLAQRSPCAVAIGTLPRRQTQLEHQVTNTGHDRAVRRIPTRPSEEEVAQLLHEAERQYEECMRLADLADLSETGEVSWPKYAWDNPLGLVVADHASAKLV